MGCTLRNPLKKYFQPTNARPQPCSRARLSRNSTIFGSRSSARMRTAGSARATRKVHQPVAAPISATTPPSLGTSETIFSKSLRATIKYSTNFAHNLVRFLPPLSFFSFHFGYPSRRIGKENVVVAVIAIIPMVMRVMLMVFMTVISIMVLHSWRSAVYSTCVVSDIV